MKKDGENAKERIYSAALELLAGGEETASITTRQIAAKAGVNLALVNYYYRSKENLLAEVVARMMEGIIEPIMEGGNESAQARLRGILISTADAAFAHRNICSIAIATELKRGCANSCAMVLPLLKEILVGLSESELIAAALQLMLPFHHIVLEPQLYGGLLGADFFVKRERDRIIDDMIGCALRPFKGV